MQDVIIIGGGITGAYTAYLFAAKDISTSIIERGSHNTPAASNLNPGGINPLHGPQVPGLMGEFSMHSYYLHQQNWNTVQQLSNSFFNPRIVSRLILAFSKKEQSELLIKQQYYSKPGFSAQYLSPAETLALDSRISTQITAALLTRGNITINAKNYTSALLSAAEKLGAKKYSDEVIEIQNKMQHAEVTLASGRKMAAKNVIIATGAWSNLFSQAYHEPPVNPIKGELLLIKLHGEPLGFDLTWGANGVYHHEDQSYWLGGTQENQGFNFSSTTAGVQSIQESTAKMLPGLAPYPILKQCAALRPGTSDGLPIIGRLAKKTNLWLATGAGSKGILWSAGIADLCVKMITNQISEAQYPHLSPERFK